MAEKQIFGSEKLQATFDNNRKSPEKDRLEVLKNMGIGPKFKKQLEKMFTEINASVEEVVLAKTEINSTNVKIENLGKNRIHRFKEAANDSSFQNAA